MWPSRWNTAWSAKCAEGGLRSVSVKDKTLHTLARSSFARNVYESLRKIPGLGCAVEKLVRSAIPPASRFWMQIPAGLGKGLWMDVDPRFDVRYMDGGHEPWIQELLASELQAGRLLLRCGSAHRIFRDDRGARGGANGLRCGV